MSRWVVPALITTVAAAPFVAACASPSPAQQQYGNVEIRGLSPLIINLSGGGDGVYAPSGPTVFMQGNFIRVAVDDSVTAEASCEAKAGDEKDTDSDSETKNFVRMQDYRPWDFANYNVVQFRWFDYATRNYQSFTITNTHLLGGDVEAWRLVVDAMQKNPNGGIDAAELLREHAAELGGGKAFAMLDFTSAAASFGIKEARTITVVTPETSGPLEIRIAGFSGFGSIYPDLFVKYKTEGGEELTVFLRDHLNPDATERVTELTLQTSQGPYSVKLLDAEGKPRAASDLNEEVYQHENPNKKSSKADRQETVLNAHKIGFVHPIDGRPGFFQVFEQKGEGFAPLIAGEDDDAKNGIYPESTVVKVRSGVKLKLGDIGHAGYDVEKTMAALVEAGSKLRPDWTGGIAGAGDRFTRSGAVRG